MSHSDELYPSEESGLPHYYPQPDSYSYQYFPEGPFSFVSYPTAYLVGDASIPPAFGDDSTTTYQPLQTSVVAESSETVLSSASSQGTPPQGTPPQGTPEALASPYDAQSALPISEQSNPGPSAIIESTSFHHDVRLKSNICDASLEKHMLLMSSRPKLYRCMICNFDSEPLRGTQAAKAHLYQHLFGTSKPYVCRTCNVEFASERAAERHKRNQIKKYPCQLCGRPFARKDAMRAHERKAKCGRILPGFPAEMHQ